MTSTIFSTALNPTPAEAAAMSETDLKNVDIDTALNEAKEAYVATNPKSLAR